MMSDPESWLAGVRRLDPDALGAAYDGLSPALFRYAYRLLGDTQVAEDVVAESFSRLLTAIRNGGGPRTFLRAYLFRVAHNLAMDYHRATPVHALDEDEMHHLAADAPQDEPSDAAAARRALWLLTAEQRQVIVLKFYQGLSNDEVAAAIDKPVGAVKSLQHRGLEALRRILTRAAGEMERVA